MRLRSLEGGHEPGEASVLDAIRERRGAEPRDDRVLLFATILQPGTFTYTYVARATAPGTFVVPPVQAEEMYRPEIFGRPYSDALDQAMRGPSDWSAGERELFAAFVSSLNQCPF